MFWDAIVTIVQGTIEITNVQRITVNHGRQSQIDSFSGARCVVVARYPNGYDTPIPELVPGTEIDITMQELDTNLYSFIPFQGYITDVSVEYGIPWDDPVGVADLLTIEAEGPFSNFARNFGNGYNMAADGVGNQVDDAITETGVQIVASGLSGKSASATVIDGSWGDWLNRMATTFAGRIAENQNRDVVLTGYQPLVVIDPATAQFSDTSGANNIAYDEIVFDSLGQNYFTQVTVSPEDYASQTVETGSAPFRNLTIQTFNDSTGKAIDLGNYLLNNYKDPVLGIASLRVNMAQESASLLKDVFSSSAGCLGVGAQVDVVFRGDTYTCVIEGASLSASPQQSSITFYVSSADLNAYLVLGNPVFGKLDENKLGF